MEDRGKRSVGKCNKNGEMEKVSRRIGAKWEKV